MNELSDYMRSTEGSLTVGQVFGTPLVVKGQTWLPLTEVVTWGVLSLAAGNRRPGRPWRERIGVGALTAVVLLGSEWCHNLAHAAVAHWIGQPAQAIRITFGMPLLIYPTPEDPSVTPRQHILRSLAGPAFNAILLALSVLARRFTRPKTVAREVVDVAVGMNLFLSTVSLIPNPEIDGGPVLKWASIACGAAPEATDRILQSANRGLGVLLTCAAAITTWRKKTGLGLLLGALSVMCLEYGLRKRR